jgi:hypothetical protein
MSFFRKDDQSTDTFWQEYEEKIGEKVQARSLGKYLSGWEEFDSNNWTNLWGLIIASESGLRFHHFPQQHWLDTFSRNRETQKEKIFLLPREKIVSVQLIKEPNWFLRLFKSPAPQLIVIYRDDEGEEKKLLLEADLIHGDLIESLNKGEK